MSLNDLAILSSDEMIGLCEYSPNNNDKMRCMRDALSSLLWLSHNEGKYIASPLFPPLSIILSSKHVIHQYFKTFVSALLNSGHGVIFKCLLI